MAKFSKYFQADELIKDMSYTSFIVLIYLIEFSILLMIFAIVYINIQYNLKGYQNLSVSVFILRIFLKLASSILYIPIFQVLLSIIKCDDTHMYY